MKCSVVSVVDVVLWCCVLLTDNSNPFFLFSYSLYLYPISSSQQETLALGKDLIDETVQSFKDVKVNIFYCFLFVKRCGKVLKDATLTYSLLSATVNFMCICKTSTIYFHHPSLPFPCSYNSYHHHL